MTFESDLPCRRFTFIWGQQIRDLKNFKSTVFWDDAINVVKLNDVSEERTALIFRAEEYAKQLQN
jgi:hypothetical protein